MAVIDIIIMIVCVYGRHLAHEQFAEEAEDEQLPKVVGGEDKGTDVGRQPDRLGVDGLERGEDEIQQAHQKLDHQHRVEDLLHVADESKTSDWPINYTTSFVNGENGCRFFGVKHILIK